MADIAEIGIGIDARQVVTAKQEIQRLGTAFNSAERSASVFVQAFDRAFKTAQRDIQYLRNSAKAFQELVNKANNVTNSYKSAEESASVFTRMLLEQEAQTLKAGRAFQELVNKANNVTNSYKSAEASASVFTEELRRQEQQAAKTAIANQNAINKQLGVGGAGAVAGGASFSAMEAELERLSLKYNKVYAASKLYEASLEELNRAQRLGAISADQLAREVDQLTLEYQQFANGATNLNNRFVQYDASLITSMKSTNRFGMVAQQVGYQVGDFFVQIQSGTNAFVAFGQQATQLAGLIPGVAGAIAGIGISLTTALLAFWSRTSQAEEAASKFGEAFKSLKEEVSSTALEIERLNRGLESTNEVVFVQEQERLQAQLDALIAQREDAYIEQSVLEAQISNLEERLSVNQEILETLRRQKREIAERNAQEAERERLEREIANRINFNYEMYGKFRREAEQITTEQEQFNQRLKDAYRLYGNLRMQADGFESVLARTASSAAVLAEKLGVSLSVASRLIGSVSRQNQPVIFDPRDPNYDPIAAEMERIRLETTQGGRATRGATGRAERLRQEIALTNELTEVERQRLDVIRSVESSLESGFMAMIDGTKSVKDAFRSMARDIIAELYRVFVVQRIVGAIGGAASLATNPNGLGFFRASGGSIMPGQSYIVGEKGPEIIRPRHSGTVVPAHLSGQGGQSSMTVNNNITVTGSDAANVRMEVAKMIPQITEATKAAVIDARRRGGQMRAAFV